MSNRSPERTARMNDLLARIVEHSPAVVLAWSDTRRERAVFASANASRLGLDAGALMAGRQSVASLIHPDDAPRVRAETELALASGRAELSLGYRLVSPNGGIVRVEEASRLMRGENGIGLEGLLLERDERLDGMREALCQSGLDFQAMVEDQTEFVSRLLPDGRLTFVNGAYCRGFGAARERLVGSSIFEFIPERDRERVREHLRGLTPERPVSTMRHREILPSGETRWLEWTDRAFFDSAGRIREYQSVGRDVTAEVTAQEALAKTNATLSAIIENMPTPIYLRDTEHRYRVLNPAYAEFWGLEPSDGLGRTPHEFLPPEAADKIVRGDLCVLRSLEPLEEEEAFYPGGQERILWSREVPLLGRDGTPWGICGVVLDITERRRVEAELDRTLWYLEERVADRTEQLREANRRLSREIEERKAAERELRRHQEQLRTIMDNLPSHVYVRDALGRFLLMNRQYERFWGLAEGSALGRTPREILPAEAAEKILADDTILLDQGQPLSLDETFIREGRLHTFMTREVPLLDEQGRIYAICGISTDVSERIRMEKALRESERTLRGLFNAIGQFVALLDTSGQVLAGNETCSRMLGLAEDALAGACIFDHFHPEEAALRRDTLERVLATGRPCLVREYSGDTIYKTSCYPILDAAGQVSRVAVFAEDITHEVSLERQLRRAQRLEAVGTLASGIAHEFNNVLTLVTGFGELAQECPAETADCLRQVLATAARGRDIVRQMLTFSRGDDRPRAAMDIGTTVRECLGLLRASLPRSIRLEADLMEEPALVQANPTQIQQLLINLASNAADALSGQQPAGGTIRVELARMGPGKPDGAPAGLLPGEHVRLSVADTGPGMQPEVLERIFDPFFTTKEPGKGTGLGLAVVHGIVTAMGGAISVASSASQGARFELFLPAVLRPRSDMPRPAQDNQSI